MFTERTRVKCDVQKQVARKGKHIFLRCKVQADPTLQVTVTWEKNGKSISKGCADGDRIFQVNVTGQNNVHFCSVCINIFFQRLMTN